ncbi:His Kinase A (phospho-acceptor) domain-containing protein [Hyunsoonleella jejuensis]|uniref:histidine kinase n=1 Tax=Hyunsoonleella jejuensis TaxID=419940 RepID=A0A1H9CDM9_9FLAO|nr:ATP-binding protein [Hyunsoonleella jejuensis]SEP98883.1 His Kinase A (phospho-acceptor) domain-containing protein [Hyunsoonleella jejuensis]
MVTYLKFVAYSILLSFVSISWGQENSNFIKLDKEFSASAQITEDNLGFMIILDGDGLHKYNGYNFSTTSLETVFGNDFTGDRQYVLKKDNQSNIWVASFKGELTKITPNGYYECYRDKLKSEDEYVQITSIKPYENYVWFGSSTGGIYKYKADDSTIEYIATLPSVNEKPQIIKGLALSDKNSLWISTLNGKIYNYAVQEKKLKLFESPLGDKTQIINLVNDASGKIWLATELDGLFSYNPSSKLFKQYDKTGGVSTASQHHLFTSLYCDSLGNIWAGTDGDGLYNIDQKNNEINIYKHQESNKFSISSNTILFITEDSNNNIWIIDKNGIINILPKGSNTIKYYNGLTNNTPVKVLSVLKAKDGSIYIGTDGKGLNRVFLNGKKDHYTKDGDNFEARYIQNLLEDAHGNIWIATYQNGLWIYYPKRDKFQKLKTIISDNLYSDDIRTLFKDSKNRIWATSTRSINIYNTNQDLLATFKYDSNGLFGNVSMSLAEDENKTVWLSVNPSQLFKFNENFNDLNDSYFTKHNYFLNDNDDLRNYNILSLVPDFQGTLWMVCASGMLIQFNLEKESFLPYYKKESLKEYFFTALLLEDPNNLWLSSLNGMHHYNLEKDELNSYYQIDGFQSKEFSFRSAFKDDEGTFYFGGENGVNAFSPKDLIKTNTEGQLYINDIEILNKPANLIIPNQVKQGVERVEHLKLDYDQSSFSFQFAAIGNIINTDYHYVYRLNGFDKDWIAPKESRTASYTNIPHGDYTFEVKAGSKRGNWNITPIAVNLSIMPPWYQSNLAYMLYLIAVALIAYSIVLWLRLKNRLAKETWENNKEKELYALKMNFFAKMSHEIQTPLTLILGPISDMLKRATDNGNELLRQRLLMIDNNANRLSRIAMELMTIRNKELGRLRVYASKNDLIADLKRISQSFSEQARFKNIDFIQEYPKNDIKIWYDSEKIEHVIYNLLSNAFKFTPSEGTIKVKVIEIPSEEEIKISVEDSGPGIPKNELDDIFKLFYQSETGKGTKGSGIGLALTKDLVNLHKGSINVSSSPETGTTFSVNLSTREDIFTQDEKVLIQDTNTISNLSKNEALISDSDYSVNNLIKDKNQTLLIVEDNIEMQMFLKDVLSDYYNLLIAPNGKEGIVLAEKHMPDLIISDIMMPVMDGIEMSKTLQKKKSTYHIPIILLTAKNSTSAKIKGLNVGAIEYIKKPFNFHELLLKVNNILTSREKIISKYKTDLISAPVDISEPSKDDIFLQDLVNEINTQLENPDFKLEDLTKTFNMSYSVIYRKYQEITGRTLIDLVKSLRLKKAALLIIKNGYNISEAAYMVGYKDPKYFAKSFKEEFGVPPATFKREAKLSGVEKIINKYKINPITQS